MHRKNLLSLLDDYRTRFPNEHDEIARFTSFVQAYPDCFERSLEVGHVTGSAWVINRTGTHALFTHHRKIGRWLQLGGHADGDSDVQSVALREVDEESGLASVRLVDETIFDIDIHRIGTRGEVPSHLHYDVRFLIQAVGNDEINMSDESNDLTWFDVARVRDQFRDESILRMLRKWLAHSSATL